MVVVIWVKCILKTALLFFFFFFFFDNYFGLGLDTSGNCSSFLQGDKFW